MSDLFQKGVPLEFIRKVFDVMNRCPQHTFQILTKRPEIAAGFADKLNWSENIWMGVSVEVLIPLEKKILNFIGEYLRENEGQSPTLSEIGEGCGIRSTGTVHRYVTSIENKSDFVIIKPAKEPRNGDIVVALVDNENVSLIKNSKESIKAFAFD